MGNIKWRAWLDSNQLPQPSEGCTLSKWATNALWYSKRILTPSLIDIFWVTPAFGGQHSIQLSYRCKVCILTNLSSGFIIIFWMTSSLRRSGQLVRIQPGAPFLHSSTNITQITITLYEFKPPIGLITSKLFCAQVVPRLCPKCAHFYYATTYWLLGLLSLELIWLNIKNKHHKRV